MNLICLGVKFLYTLNKDKDHKIFILKLCLYSTKQRKGALMHIKNESTNFYRLKRIKSN